MRLSLKYLCWILLSHDAINFKDSEGGQLIVKVGTVNSCGALPLLLEDR